MPHRPYIPAHPRTPEEIKHLTDYPGIVAAAERRGISQVVHFTTVKGAVGILASNAVKSRARLPEDQYLEYVYKPNALCRKDIQWLDYVNLSIECINDWMFQTSVRWHVAENNPWVVLAFSTEILAHPGVVFTTTNNIYPSCERSEGLAGFCRIFSGNIEGRYGKQHDRRNKPTAWPTDRQAEILYPGELSLSYLLRIEVQQEQSLETLDGALPEFDVDVPIGHAPEVFE